MFAKAKENTSKSLKIEFNLSIIKEFFLKMETIDKKKLANCLMVLGIAEAY